MKVVLSTDADPKYSYFLPITVWMWKQFGFDAIVFTLGDIPQAALDYTQAEIHQLQPIKGYRDCTIVQMSRLYGACVSDDYMIIGDIDMFPLSDWFDKFNKPMFAGWDITGYSEIPMCYVGMGAEMWRTVMRIDGDYMANITRDLKGYRYLINQFESYWSADQQILTQRMKSYGLQHFTQVDRGGGSIGVNGRVCRSNWQFPQQPTEKLIDCHAMRNGYADGYFERNMQVIEAVTTGSDWIYEYNQKFKEGL